MKKPTRKDYDYFRWLPIESWTVDKLCGPIWGLTICCKICDDYIARNAAESHIDSHVKTRKKQLASDKKKAQELRLEKARIARELKKQERESELLSKKEKENQ